MNEGLQKPALTFSYSMTSYLRRAAKSDLKAFRVVRDLSEKKKHTFSSFIKIWLAEVKHNRQCLTSHTQWHAAEITISHRIV